MPSSWLGGYVAGKFLDGVVSVLRKLAPRRVDRALLRAARRDPITRAKLINPGVQLLEEAAITVRSAAVLYTERDEIQPLFARGHFQMIADQIFANHRAVGVRSAQKAGLNVVVYANNGSPEEPKLEVIARHTVSTCQLEGSQQVRNFEIANRCWEADSGSWVELLWRAHGPVWTGKSEEARTAALSPPSRRHWDLSQYNSYLGTPIGSWDPIEERTPYGVLLLTAARSDLWRDRDPDPVETHVVSLLREQLQLLFLLLDRRGALPLPPLEVEHVHKD